MMWVLSSVIKTINVLLDSKDATIEKSVTAKRIRCGKDLFKYLIFKVF